MAPRCEGLYAYHCHILEHEDHEMMRQFRTLPEPSAMLGLGSGVLMLVWLARRRERRRWPVVFSVVA